MKTHKENQEMRPIVSNINAPSSKIAKWLVEKYTEYQMPKGRAVKNSLEFVEKIRNVEMDDEEAMVSFDIQALFPSIPVSETLRDLKEWLNDSRLTNNEFYVISALTKMCMEQTQFKFNKKYYKQTDKGGTNMGNALSPVIANFFLATKEEKLLNEVWFPKHWWRYVDDIFCIVKKSEINNTLNKLNQIHSNIKFTCEQEKDGCLPFLDLKLVRVQNKIQFEIYHKQTSSQQYIHSTSAHPVTHKYAAYNSALHRLCNIPLTQQGYDAELKYIYDTAVKNGYKIQNIQKLLHKHERKANIMRHTKLIPIKDKDKFSYLSMPFYPEITNKLERKLHKHNIKVAYNANGKLRDVLGTTKEKIPTEEKSGIYKIVCQENCEKFYIGKTRRMIKERRKEHEDNVRNKKPHLSAMAKHCLEANHKMGNVVLLNEIRQEWKIDIMEDLYICKNATSNLVNLDLKEIRNTSLFQLIDQADLQ